MEPAGSDISPERAAELARAGEADLIDVREPYEHDAGHIEGARHVPVDQLQAAAATLDPERPTVFYCRTGARSRFAVDAFQGAGFAAYNLDGGLLAWAERGLPLEPEDGRVAEH